MAGRRRQSRGCGVPAAPCQDAPNPAKHFDPRLCTRNEPDWPENCLVVGSMPRCELIWQSVPAYRLPAGPAGYESEFIRSSRR